tara:strand:- start:865 stop:1086 length:222 start_codon:yes stop_codon:yes gene_type:complete
MKSYLRGFISGVILALSSVMFMGAQFGSFKNINDVYNLVIEVKEDVEYLKKWGVECNGGSIEDVENSVKCDSW